MPRTAITVNTQPFQGSSTVTTEAADSANGMMFVNNGKTVFLVENGSGGSINVTVSAVTDEAGRETDLVKAVANGAQAFFGPFRQSWWNQRSGDDIGYVYVDFTADTSVTVAAYSIQL